MFNYGQPFNRAIAIEFLSIDAINIPFNSRNNTYPDPGSIPHAYFARKGQYLHEVSVENAWWGSNPLAAIDPGTNTQHIAINTNNFVKGIPIKKHQNKNIDIIRVYANKTCDIFDDCIKVVSSTYSGNYIVGKAKLWYYKLNKK